jgi:hypothetical protein
VPHAVRLGRLRWGDATVDVPSCQPFVSGEGALPLVLVGPWLSSGRLIAGLLVGVLSEPVVCLLLVWAQAMPYGATLWLAGGTKLLVGGRIF